MEKNEEIIIDGIIFKPTREVDVRNFARSKLVKLLNNVDEKTATPEMLEASVRIAELLLKD